MLSSDINQGAKISYFILLVVHGLLRSCFGYRTQMACHIRWLLDDQLKVAKPKEIRLLNIVSRKGVRWIIRSRLLSSLQFVEANAIFLR